MSHRALSQCALAAAIAFAVGPAPGAPPAPPPLRLVAVPGADPAHLRTLAELGADVVAREGDVVRLLASDHEIAFLVERGLPVAILEPDVEAATRRRLGVAAAAYHTFDEVVAELDRLRARRPDLVGPRIAIGHSWEGRPLWAVQISDHPERVEEEEPAVLFDALHHAREPLGMETLLATMSHLVDHYDSDPDVRALIDHRALWFVPVVNPDGYVRNGIGGLWRKNRRPNADGSFGVDLNRNYDHRWGADDRGSSPLPASPIYRGPAPFSEPETAALRDFIRARRFVAGMTLHAFGELNLLPNEDETAPSWSAPFHEEVAADLERLNGYPYGPPHEILYASNGRTQDWQVHAAGMVVIEPEIGTAADGFWPLPARVDALTRKNVPALLHLARIAGPHLEPVAANDRDPGSAPGDTLEIVLVVRNKGLAAAHEVTVTVRSGSPTATVLAGRAALDAIPSRTTVALEHAPVRLHLAPEAVIGDPIPLLVHATCRGGAAPPAVVELVPGVPALLFADDAESGLARWVAAGGFGLAPSGDGGAAFADSPAGPYAPHANATLTLRDPLDLSAVRSAVLSYRERIAAEPWRDLCFVEAWTPELGWRPLAVIPGGVKSRFEERRLSLAAYAGNPLVGLRFRLTANHEREADGWAIDDIAVWAYTAAPGPALAGGAAPPPAGAAAAAAGE